MPFLMRVLTNSCQRVPLKLCSPSGSDEGGRTGPPSDAGFGASPLRPAVGDHATGHGVSGTVIAVSDDQPLAADGIWRVTLAGEEFGRLVRCCSPERGGKAWQLLRLDDMSDEQLDAYEASMDNQGGSGTAPPS